MVSWIYVSTSYTKSLIFPENACTIHSEDKDFMVDSYHINLGGPKWVLITAVSWQIIISFHQKLLFVETFQIQKCRNEIMCMCANKTNLLVNEHQSWAAP